MNCLLSLVTVHTFVRNLSVNSSPDHVISYFRVTNGLIPTEYVRFPDVWVILLILSFRTGHDKRDHKKTLVVVNKSVKFHENNETSSTHRFFFF